MNEAAYIFAMQNEAAYFIAIVQKKKRYLYFMDSHKPRKISEPECTVF